MKKEEVWSEVREQLRSYVVARDWNVDYIVMHLNLKPQSGRRTVFLWLGDFNPPAGNNLIALWFMLHELGFPAPGISKLDSAVQYAGKLFAFGVTSLENICLKAFSLHGTPQELYRILRGDRSQRRQAVHLGDEYDPELRRRVQRAIDHEQEIVKSSVSIRTLLAQL